MLAFITMTIQMCAVEVNIILGMVRTVLLCAQVEALAILKRDSENWQLDHTEKVRPFFLNLL